ncbi:hypothetical protein ACT691_08890 [Vibrio metschnikovii]
MQSVSAPILNTIIELAHQSHGRQHRRGRREQVLLKAKQLANKGFNINKRYFYSKPLDLSAITKGKSSTS